MVNSVSVKFLRLSIYLYIWILSKNEWSETPVETPLLWTRTAKISVFYRPSQNDGFWAPGGAGNKNYLRPGQRDFPGGWQVGRKPVRSIGIVKPI